MPIVDSRIHITCKIWHPEQVNIYDSTVGEGTKIASFAEIGGSVIGKNCKIECGAFIPPGTVIGDYVFIGPQVIICNDKYPNAMAQQWERNSVTIKDRARVGAGSVILPGIVIGENATVGAGSVVAENVPDGAVVYGEKAKPREIRCLNKPTLL